MPEIEQMGFEDAGAQLRQFLETLKAEQLVQMQHSQVPLTHSSARLNQPYIFLEHQPSA